MLGNLSRLEGIYPQNVDYACPPGAHYRQKPLKNTAFLHFSIFAGWHFSMRNKPCKTQCFVYFTHSKHRKLQRLQWGGAPPRFHDEGRRQGGRPYIRQGAQGARRPCPCRRPSPLSEQERGESPPCRRPLHDIVFYSVFCFFHFSGFVAQDGSTWPNIASNNAGNACCTGVLRLHRGRMLG